VTRAKALLYFGASVAAAAALSSIHYSWADWKPATCIPGACFCEAIRAGTVRQPANAWSSLAFALVAFLVLAQAAEDRRAPRNTPRNPMVSRRSFQLIYVLALMFIGFGSAFYHASLTFTGQFFDVFGMYLLAMFILTYNVNRLQRLSDRAAVAMYTIGNLVLAVLLVTVPALRRYLFAALLLAALGLEYAIRRRSAARMDPRLILGAVAALGIAFGIWVLDITRVACWPASLLQGHALWHFGGAISAWLIYLYYRSELIETVD
jgi:hypothetical protein